MHVCARVACGARADCLSRPLARVDRTAKPRPFACVACTGAHARARTRARRHAPRPCCSPRSALPPAIALIHAARTLRDRSLVVDCSRVHVHPTLAAALWRASRSAVARVRCRSLLRPLAACCRRSPSPLAARHRSLPQRPLAAATRACAQLTSAAIARHIRSLPYGRSPTIAGVSSINITTECT